MHRTTDRDKILFKLNEQLNLEIATLLRYSYLKYVFQTNY